MPHGGNVVLTLVALSLAKKASVLLVAKLYGFPRLYRRMMELNRRFVADPMTRVQIRDRVQMAFRLPRTVAANVRRRINGQRAELSLGLAAVIFLGQDFIHMEEVLNPPTDTAQSRAEHQA